MSTTKDTLIWTLKLRGYERVALTPTSNLTITNIALSVTVAKVKERVSLLFCVDDENADPDTQPVITVCSFLSGRIENHFCSLVLFTGKTYTIKVAGNNEIDLIGTCATPPLEEVKQRTFDDNENVAFKPISFEHLVDPPPVESPRKQGRPKKANLPSPSKSKSAALIAPNTPSKAAAPPEESPTKRGRGRPKKAVLPSPNSKSTPIVPKTTGVPSKPVNVNPNIFSNAAVADDVRITTRARVADVGNKLKTKSTTAKPKPPFT